MHDRIQNSNDEQNSSRLFEIQIEQLINMCFLHRVAWLSQNRFNSAEMIAQDLVTYVVNGRDKAYSKFWTYKTSCSILELIEQNRVFGLLSNDSLVRAIAIEISKQTFSIKNLQY